MRKIPVQNYMEGAQIHHTRVDQRVMICQPRPNKTRSSRDLDKAVWLGRMRQ